MAFFESNLFVTKRYAADPTGKTLPRDHSGPVNTILVGTYIALLCFLAPHSAFAETLHLKFGLYTADKPSKLVRQFRPVLNELETILSKNIKAPVKIKIVIAKTYLAGHDNLVDGNVDFSRMGPASYIAVKRRSPGISVLAMESKKGKRKFYGIICVPSDSSIRSISELKGKRFAFGNEKSTIGRYLSQWLLVKNGITAKDLAHFKYLGRHDLVAIAVARKEFDAGALKESAFKSQVKKGAKIREIARIEVATQPWIAGAHMPAKTVSALRAALLKVTNKKALKKLKSGPLLKGSDQNYDLIRKAMDENKAFFTGK